MDFESIKQAVLSELQTNEFFKGGAVIALIGWLTMRLRVIPGTIQRLAERFGTVSVTFSHGNEEFNAMASEIIRQYEGVKTGEFLHVPMHGDEVQLVPSGSRWLRKGLCLINTVFSRRELQASGMGSHSVTFTLEITACGIGKTRAVKALIADATRDFRNRKQGRLHVQSCSDGWWEDQCELPSRTFDNVYSDWSTAIREDLDRFLSQEQDYVKKGIPWRRGYCLCGPPGTGKTSMAIAMANHLARDLRIVGRQSGKDLAKVISGDRGLTLMEDIDAMTSVVKSRKEDRDDSSSLGFNLAELLNAIDGAMSGHGAIMILTTNYPGRIDDALMRPGRIDLVCEMGYLTASEWDALCESYFGEHLPLMPAKMTAAEAQSLYQRSEFDQERFLQLIQQAGDTIGRDARTETRGTVETSRAPQDVRLSC